MNGYSDGLPKLKQRHGLPLSLELSFSSLDDMKETVRISRKKYVINGKTYRNVEEMPPDIKKIFKDTDRDGIPDIIESARDEDSSVTIEINGKKYESWDEVPQKFQKYRKLRDNVLGTGKERQLSTVRTESGLNLPSLIARITIIIVVLVVLYLLSQYIF